MHPAYPSPAPAYGRAYGPTGFSRSPHGVRATVGRVLADCRDWLDARGRIAWIIAMILAFVIAGGALYTAGAIVYGFKRPNPSPRWFGFHEIFHALTILAFISHFVAATLALFGPIAQTG